MSDTLSRPARSVSVYPGDTLEQTIDHERKRRLALRAKRRAYHYWRERGDTEAPREEYWCDHCAGFYGVPHDGQEHQGDGLCRNLGRNHDCRQCACIDCVVFEAWSAARS